MSEPPEMSTEPQQPSPTPTPTPTPTPKIPLWRRIVRRTTKALLWFVLVLLLLVGLALGWLHTGWGKTWTRDQAQTQIQNAITGTATLENLDYALGGFVSASGLVLRDSEGRTVLSLEDARVSPGWGSLIGSGPVQIESVSIQNLQLNVTQLPNGSVNLQSLIKPRPPSAPTNSASRGIELQTISLSGIGAHFDGLTATAGLENLSLTASLSSAPNTLRANIDALDIQRLWFTRGSLFGVWLQDLSLTLSATRDGHVLNASLHDLHAQGTLRFPGVNNDKQFALSLKNATIERTPDLLRASLDHLGIGVVSLDRVALELPTLTEGKDKEKTLSDLPFRLSLDGLVLHANALNRLFDRPILATDIRAHFLAEGPPRAVAVSGTIDTRGGLLSALGTLNISDMQAPTYDITLTGENINTTKLLDARTRRLPLLESSLSLHIQGQGVTRDTVNANISANIGATRVEGVPVEGVTLKASLRQGHITVESLRVLALGQTLAVRGGFDPEKRQINTHLRLDGDADAIAARCKAERIPCPDILAHSEGTLSIDLTGSLRLPPADTTKQPDSPPENTTTKLAQVIGHLVLKGDNIVTPHTQLTHLEVDMQGSVSDWDAQKPFTRAQSGLLPEWVLSRLPFQAGHLQGHATMTGFAVPETNLTVDLAHAILDVDFTGPQPLGTVEVSGQNLRLGLLSIKDFTLLATLETNQIRVQFDASDPDQNLNIRARADLTRGTTGWRARVVDLHVNAPALGGVAITLKAPIELDIPDTLLKSPQTLTIPEVFLSALGGEIAVSCTLQTAPKPPEPTPPTDNTNQAKTAPKIAITDAQFDVSFKGISVGALASLASAGGKAAPNIPAFAKRGRISGAVSVHGVPTSPTAKVNLQVDFPDIPKLNLPLKLAINADADFSGVSLDASAMLGKSKIINASASVPLTKNADGKPTLDAAKSLHVTINTPDIALNLLEPLLTKLPKPLRGALDTAHASLSVNVKGTPQKLTGDITFNAWGFGRGLPETLTLSAQIKPAGHASSEVTGDFLVLWREGAEALRGNLSVTGLQLPTATQKNLRIKTWRVLLDVPQQPLESIKPFVSGLKKLATGEVALHLDAHGNLSDAVVSLTASLQNLTQQESALPPLSAQLAVSLDPALNPDGLVLSLEAALNPPNKDPLEIKARGLISIPAAGILKRARSTKGLTEMKTSAIHLEVDAPKHTLDEWAAAIPAFKPLAAWPGALSLNAVISGTMTKPLLLANAHYDGFVFQDQTPGALNVRLDLDNENLSAALTLGTPDSTSPDITKITAQFGVSTQRAPLETFKFGQAIPLAISLKSDPERATLGALLPASLVPETLKTLEGTFDADLSGHINLQTGLLGMRLENPDLHGHIRLRDGAFPIPGTSRTITKIALDLTADGDLIILKNLEAHERDAQNPDRAIVASGELSLVHTKPERATLHITTRDWLAVGKSYAPTAAITLDADISADFTQNPRQVQANINSLNLQNPNRFKFAHAQDFLDRGDVVFLAPDQTPGKLTAPAPPAPMASLIKSDPAWSIELTLPERARAYFSPLDMVVGGALRADITPDGFFINGEIKVFDGEMEFTGTRYPLSTRVPSRVFFDAASAEGCERGCLDLHFEREPDLVVQRDLALSAGKMGVSLVGVIGKQDLILRGAGNTDLTDVSAIQNARRARYISHPDMPASQTVQHPGPDTPLIHTFLRTNMPHLILVDRASAWADPLDSQGAYGQLRHAEIDDYSTDGKRRVHVEAQPPTPGLSRASVSYDFLLLNSPRWLAGVGLRMGETAKTGAHLFFRWSSEQ